MTAGRRAPALPATSGWRRIDAIRALGLHGRGPLDAPPAVKAALAGCERAAKEVQDLAARMTAGRTDMGELAAKSVGARGIARAACAVAAVRIALAGSRPEDLSRLEASSARWRAPH